MCVHYILFLLNTTYIFDIFEPQGTRASLLAQFDTNHVFFFGTCVSTVDRTSGMHIGRAEEHRKKSTAASLILKYVPPPRRGRYGQGRTWVRHEPGLRANQ